MNKRDDREKDIVLRFAVIIMITLLVIGGIVVAVRLLNPKVDIEEGSKLLTQMEAVDVDTVDEQIQELEKAERDADKEKADRSTNEIFATSFILGDSITQGLYEFEIISASRVRADRGAEVTRVSNKLVDEHVASAEAANPEHLFLAYGMNDMVAARGDAQVFVDAYKGILDELKEKLPDTAIYVNGILPVQQKVIDRDEYYAHIGEYNAALQALCEEEEVTYIDNASLIKEEYYTADGVHMNPEYYTEWVAHMAEVADL